MEKFKVVKTQYGNMEFDLHEGDRVVGSRVRFVGQLPEVDFKKAVCVHHDDLDGRMAAQELYEMGVRSFVEVDYGANAIEKDHQLSAIFDGAPETVFILDYSLTEKSLDIVMSNIKKLSGCRLIWMDHHASSFRIISKIVDGYSDLAETGKVYIDINNNRSGAAIVHDNYVQKFRELGMSDRCIELVDDYDRWVGQYPESGCLNMYMFTSSCMRVGESLMHEILYDINGALDKAISFGSRLMEVAKMKNEIVYEAFSYEKEVHGLKCRILVGFGNSLMFGEHIKDYDAVIVTHMDKDKKWVFSMYTDKDYVDCSEICSKYYGGGGHRKAAGGSSLERPF